MTIEERILVMIEDIKACKTAEDVRSVFKRTINTTIEDCAKVADDHERQEQEAADESNRNGKGLSQLGHVFEATAAKTIADNIRALAGPTSISTEEKKES